MLLSLLFSNSSEPVKTGNLAVCMCVGLQPIFLLLTEFSRMLRKFQSEDKEMSVLLMHARSLFALIPFFRLSTLDIVPGQDKLKSMCSSAVGAAFRDLFCFGVSCSLCIFQQLFRACLRTAALRCEATVVCDAVFVWWHVYLVADMSIVNLCNGR
jgi:hypothetical protein